MPWTIKDKVSNLFEVGDYEFRLEEITVQKPASENENSLPSLRFKWKVIGGERDGAIAFQNFPMNPNYLGILGAVLAGSGQFEEDEELPDDTETLARVLEARMAGKTYDIAYAHRIDRKTKRAWPDITVKGPTTANFR